MVVVRLLATSSLLNSSMLALLQVKAKYRCRPVETACYHQTRKHRGPEYDETVLLSKSEILMPLCSVSAYRGMHADGPVANTARIVCSICWWSLS
ncbi:uncharacterized protein HD556DRAFT_1325575 [Suillus plorans]|uniref:Secreted protein n=1 Tax=Suillus plorans TaxID=116603 RepID=A0A9P7J694_9AGAM|nr:uncharacterized protein HD556DRAFT_1325575 [Suillus plorans]KAG1804704.1 hypothetical protein HD556DRAFT_1325575 [Suillus plorans]